MARRKDGADGRDDRAGELIIIGGGEEKDRHPEILRRVTEKATGDRGKLVIVTAATTVPEEYLEDYVPLFKDLDVKNIEVLDIRSRTDAHNEENVKKLEGADVIFFTGGSQMRIASVMGGSPICEGMRKRYHAGATVAGTSAGAAVMPETMLISGPSDVSPDADELDMAAGLGLLDDVIVDTHFAERGRMGRLLTAVAQNPRLLGLGIDEDTAVVMDCDQNFEVIGSGAVYVVDGTTSTYTSMIRRPRGVVTIHDARLHVLTDGDRFHWEERHPEVTKERDTNGR